MVIIKVLPDRIKWKSLTTNYFVMNLPENRLKQHSNTRSNSNKSIFYLSEAELKRLRISNPKSKKLQEQKDIFIFQCYTGFRISDLNRFNVHMVSEDRRFIKTRAYKTDEQINIPILPEAFDCCWLWC